MHECPRHVAGGQVCFKVSKVHLTRREEVQAREYQEKSGQLYDDALGWYTRAVAEDPCNRCDVPPG